MLCKFVMRSFSLCFPDTQMRLFCSKLKLYNVMILSLLFAERIMYISSLGVATGL